MFLCHASDGNGYKKNTTGRLDVIREPCSEEETATGEEKEEEDKMYKETTAIAVLLLACMIMHVAAHADKTEHDELTEQIRTKLDAVERNLTSALDDILKDDKSFTYGKIREAMRKMHGLLDILLWEKKADGTKVPRQKEGMIVERKFPIRLLIYSIVLVLILYMCVVLLLCLTSWLAMDKLYKRVRQFVCFCKTKTDAASDLSSSAASYTSAFARNARVSSHHPNNEEGQL